MIANLTDRYLLIVTDLHMTCVGHLAVLLKCGKLRCRLIKVKKGAKLLKFILSLRSGSCLIFYIKLHAAV